VKGSEYYVAHPFIPNSAVTAFLNLESVGRGERIGVGSGRNYPQIYEVMENINARFIHRPISASQNANLARPRQDAAHFLWANIPTVSIGTSGAPPLPGAPDRDRWNLARLWRGFYLSTVELATSERGASLEG
jgi:Zn-dependent M28 family amino/carboxypeptidase